MFVVVLGFSQQIISGTTLKFQTNQKPKKKIYFSFPFSFIFVSLYVFSLNHLAEEQELMNFIQFSIEIVFEIEIFFLKIKNYF